MFKTSYNKIKNNISLQIFHKNKEIFVISTKNKFFSKKNLKREIKKLLITKQIYLINRLYANGLINIKNLENQKTFNLIKLFLIKR